jgi:hypothetical protein
MDAATGVSSNVAVYVDTGRKPKDRFIMLKVRQPSLYLARPDAARCVARLRSEFEE